MMAISSCSGEQYIRVDLSFHHQPLGQPLGQQETSPFINDDS